jgi:mannose-6-phosphate isomerase-like protein (cupin superfamily)
MTDAVTTAGLGVLLVVLVQSPSAPVIPATVVPASDIQAVAAQSIANKVSDTSIRTVDAGGHNVGIGVVYRGKGTGLKQFSSHDRVTEVYQVLEGAGTLVTGGGLVDPVRRQSGSEAVGQMNGPSLSGTAIDGGVSRHLVKGDMVIIPAGTPHGFAEVDETMTVVVVRIDPSRVIALK